MDIFLQKINHISKNPAFQKRLIIALVALNSILFIYLLFGFGKVSFSGAEYETLYVNENNVGNKKNLSLRPGTYTLRASGSQVTTDTYKITVYPFIAKIIPLKKSTPDTILVDAKLGPPLDSPYTSKKSSFVHDGTWLVAKYENNRNGNRLVVAFRYMLGDWRAIAYSPNENTVISTEKQNSMLPSDVLIEYESLKEITDEQ